MSIHHTFQALVQSRQHWHQFRLPWQLQFHQLQNLSKKNWLKEPLQTWTVYHPLDVLLVQPKNKQYLSLKRASSLSSTGKKESILCHDLSQSQTAISSLCRCKTISDEVYSIKPPLSFMKCPLSNWLPERKYRRACCSLHWRDVTFLS